MVHMPLHWLLEEIVGKDTALTDSWGHVEPRWQFFVYFNITECPTLYCRNPLGAQRNCLLWYAFGKELQKVSLGGFEVYRKSAQVTEDGFL